MNRDGSADDQDPGAHLFVLGERVLTEATNRSPVRVMTYNIHRWAGRDQRIDVDRLAEVVRGADADIVGLNEVIHPVIMGGRKYEPLCELAERLEMHYAFGPSGWFDRGPGWYGPVGNAILSKYALGEVTNTRLPRLPSTKQRSLLGARLETGPAQGLHAFITHLDHFFEGTRLWQIRGVLRRIAQDGPHFLGGDFNTPGFHGRRAISLTPPVLRWMQGAGYLDAFRAVGSGSGRTFPALSPLFRIDFLFFPLKWAAGLRSATTVDFDITMAASDHRPLLAEWMWPERARATAAI